MQKNYCTKNVNRNYGKQMSEVIYLHVHYDYENNIDVVCRDAKCYQKLLEDKKKLQEYQDIVDRDLQRKENLMLINDFMQDPRIDNYNNN